MHYNLVFVDEENKAAIMQTTILGKLTLFETTKDDGFDLFLNATLTALRNCSIRL